MLKKGHKKFLVWGLQSAYKIPLIKVVKISVPSVVDANYWSILATNFTLKVDWF
jgi:hypothetical protein